jgi:hypothetical protein
MSLSGRHGVSLLPGKLVVAWISTPPGLLGTSRRFATPCVVAGTCGHLCGHLNGSVNVYFGPEAPEGKESIWIQILPGKGWFADPASLLPAGSVPRQELAGR